MSAATAKNPLALADAPDGMSAAQAARVCGVGEDLIRELCLRGEFPHVRLGRRLVIPKHLLAIHLAGLNWRDPNAQAEAMHAYAGRRRPRKPETGSGP